MAYLLYEDAKTAKRGDFLREKPRSIKNVEVLGLADAGLYIGVRVNGLVGWGRAWFATWAELLHP